MSSSEKAGRTATAGRVKHGSPVGGRKPAENQVRHSPFLVVLSSPSGAGKTSICRGVLALDRGLAYSVSATTRPRRKGEVHGRSYYFYTEDDFARRARSGEFLEHARVYDHSYGTPRAHVLACFARGRDVIADLDIKGMLSCKRALPGTVGIFITTPALEDLGQRLTGRGTDSDSVIRRRQAEVSSELAAIPKFDYLVVNDRLELAVAEVHAIIRAERLRTQRVLRTARRGLSRIAAASERPGTVPEATAKTQERK